VVRALRFRRLNATRDRVQQLKSSLIVITPSTAQEIAHVSLLYDMPFFSKWHLKLELYGKTVRSSRRGDGTFQDIWNCNVAFMYPRIYLLMRSTVADYCGDSAENRRTE
jgi:hypothetical protein